MLEENPYKLMDSKSMVGCYLIVFCKTNLAHQVKGLYNLKVKTGLGGNAGNKGAVACRIHINKTAFIFINCHLMSGRGLMEKRMEELNFIMNETFT